MAVLVLDKRKKPLMPCSEKRARLLLERGRAFRRRRRSRLHHRASRFDNRTRPRGWLAPSLQHRVDTTLARVNRLCRLVPITAIDMELVRFDMQAMENPEISGVEYQQGTLAGYEVREYLLEKWQRCCAYCGAGNVPLEIDHIHPESRGGSDRVSNLTLACHDCNQAKGNQPVEVFLADEPKRLQRIKVQAKAPLKEAAAVNSTRWVLFRQLQATGRGSYQRTRLDRFGFPRGVLLRQKQVKGFQTGDLVQAQVPTGKKAGTYQGRVAIRATGRFNIRTRQGVVQGISHRHCRLLQRADGYGYTFQPKPTQEDATRAA